jgi:hypothetical protein
VGPVNKVVERRQIRRAAEEALTDPRLRLPVPPADVDETQSADLPPGFGGVARSNGFAPHPTTEPAFTALTFRVAPEPWYRTNAAKLVLVVVGLGAPIARRTALAQFDVRTSTSGCGQHVGPGAVAKCVADAIRATQHRAASSCTGAAGRPAPDGSPPPAPPSADQMAPPAAPPRYYPPQNDEPTQQKPEIDVTRALISVAPSITGPQALSGSAVPGEARKRRGFF